MVVYDDVAQQDKIKIFDARVERPPHYDTFAEFHYAYHYGDMYSPFIKQEEPLKAECQHFLECIQNGTQPITDGEKGLELVRILEASSASLRQGGGPISMASGQPWRAAAQDTALDETATRVSSRLMPRPVLEHPAQACVAV